MTYSISRYLCSTCIRGSGFVGEITSGIFVQTPGQLSSHSIHSSSHPSKPINGVFLNTGLTAYESGARHMAANGFAAVESHGGINLYAVFEHPMAFIERRGVSGCLTTTGKMPMADRPAQRHWFGYTGFDGLSGTCAQCGTRIF
ncbi:MAG: hypothetical protein H7343_13100 [Undibacterium sp.]|nr:hypothetical protein [Opitutaceae bacterium]